MLDRSIVSQLAGAVRRFPRANKARSSMQAALDSTALMLAKDLSDGRITTDRISTKATKNHNT